MCLCNPREMGAGSERENSNSNALFYKDCSLGSEREEWW